MDSPDIYASLDQGGYGTGGEDVFRRLDALLDDHSRLEPHLGDHRAYRDVTFPLSTILDQAHQNYWQGRHPPPVRQELGSGGTRYSPRHQRGTARHKEPAGIVPTGLQCEPYQFDKLNLRALKKTVKDK